MNDEQPPTSEHAAEVRERLHHRVHRAARRGQRLRLLRILLLCAAMVVGGLFVLVVKDALFVLPGNWRGTLLCLLLLGVLGGWLTRSARAWHRQHLDRAAGERIDRVADARPQPVTVGLSLNPSIDDDSLAQLLLQRAEARAAGVAEAIEPKQAYPLRQLQNAGGALALTLGLWLLLGLMWPSQFAGLLTRVLMPWRDAPPFSLTQLDPHWEPRPPEAGADVHLHVSPEGRLPTSIDWVRLDGNGQETERFAMTSDGQGGFGHRLRAVETPIDFRLEAFGRQTRTFTITPTPREPIVMNAAVETEPSQADSSSGGTTSFDPQRVARRDLTAHKDWPKTKADLQELLRQLADVQAIAESLPPTDGQAIEALAEQLQELVEQAQAMAGQLAQMQGDLPPEAAGLLGDLRDALASMQSGSLPAPPGTQASSPGRGEADEQWLEQAADAAESDQAKIGQGIGLGTSDEPTAWGSASGQSGESPDLLDPNTFGTYREAGGSGEQGPLPDAVIQQVPPSYRAYVSAYFDRLAEEERRP